MEMKSKSSQQIVAEVLAGFRGETAYNDPSKAIRMMPGLTFKDAVPADVKAEMNMTTPKEGPMVDTWVLRRPNSSLK